MVIGCISQWQSKWERVTFELHSTESKTLQLIFMKLKFRTSSQYVQNLILIYVGGREGIRSMCHCFCVVLSVLFGFFTCATGHATIWITALCICKIDWSCMVVKKLHVHTDTVVLLLTWMHNISFTIDLLTLFSLTTWHLAKQFISSLVKNWLLNLRIETLTDLNGVCGSDFQLFFTPVLYFWSWTPAITAPVLWESPVSSQDAQFWLLVRKTANYKTA